MSDLVQALWVRALDSMGAARHVEPVSVNKAASCAYYAAFYATSAYFAARGRTFKKHSALEAAIHRDIIKTGIWPVELGKMYSALIEARDTGDYGEMEFVTHDEAVAAIKCAWQILQAVHRSDPKMFPMEE